METENPEREARMKPVRQALSAGLVRCPVCGLVCEHVLAVHGFALPALQHAAAPP